jgi:hypothetical protein
MVESDRKNKGHAEQQHEDVFVLEPEQEQQKTDQEDYEFRGYDVGENRAQKEPVLSLKEREAVGAVVPDTKRLTGNPGFATSGTKQSQRAIQHTVDPFNVLFQDVGILARRQENAMAYRSLDTKRRKN